MNFGDKIRMFSYKVVDPIIYLKIMKSYQTGSYMGKGVSPMVLEEFKR